MLASWLPPDARHVDTDDGPALQLDAPGTPDRRRQLSGLIDLLALQIGPGMINRPIRAFGLLGGRWKRIEVKR